MSRPSDMIIVMNTVDKRAILVSLQLLILSVNYLLLLLLLLLDFFTVSLELLRALLLQMFIIIIL